MRTFVLFVLYRLRGFFERRNVNFGQLYAIVAVKLTMDERRVYLNWRQSQQREGRNQLTMILLAYALYGLFVGILISAFDSFLIDMAIYHGFLLLVMSMTLVTDFSSVLLDTTDNQVILPRPVDGRTLFVARLVHIFVYLAQFGFALSAIPLAATAWKFGVVIFLGAIVTTGLTILFALFLTYLLYMLLIRFVNIGKVREAVTYFQIVVTIFFAGAAQILPRMANRFDFQHNLHPGPSWYALPVMWFAGALEALHDRRLDGPHAAMILLSLLVPAILFVVLVKWLAPSFSAKLAGMTDAAESGTTDGRKRSGRWGRIFAGIFCRKPAERAAFRLAWAVTGRDKPFRLQFYPSLAYMVVLGGVLLFGEKFQQGDEPLLRESTRFLGLAYMPLFSVMTGVLLLAFSENYPASWLYQSAPLRRPGELITGAAKSLFVKFFLPAFLLMFACGLAIWGPRIVPDFVLGLSNDIFCFLVILWFAPRYLPFSRQPRTRQQAGRFIAMLLQVLVVGALVGLHFLVLSNPVVKWMLVPLGLAASWLLLTELQRVGWEKIQV